MNNRFPVIAAILGLSLLLNGCIVYKIDIQQGNDITEEMVAQLELGMTKREVTRLLGYPLINDPFHKDRWDYYYSYKVGKTGEISQHTVSLKFTDDLLSEYKDSFSETKAEKLENPD